MKNTMLLSGIFLAVFVVYWLLIPVRLHKTDIFYLDHYYKISELSGRSGEVNGSFYTDNEYGSIDLDKGMKFYIRVDDNRYVMGNKHFYLSYEKAGTVINIYKPTGELNASIETAGYPYIYKDLPVFYVVKTNGTGLALYGADGNKLWSELNFTSIITAISADNKLNTLISTLEGKTFLYSIKGDLLSQSFFNNNSKYHMTKSSLINDEGNYIAICSGIEPEYIDIYPKNLGIKLSQIKTKTNFRYPLLLKFYKNRLYFEGDQALYFYDFIKAKMGKIDLKGELKEVVIAPNGLLLIASRYKDINYLSLFSSTGSIQYYAEFKEPVSNFHFINNHSFYFKLSDMIIKMSLKVA